MFTFAFKRETEAWTGRAEAGFYFGAPIRIFKSDGNVETKDVTGELAGLVLASF